MKHKIITAFLVVILIAIIAWIEFSIAECIAESDMNPWLKAWLLFGGKDR